jgi:hypothetical protein
MNTLNWDSLKFKGINDCKSDKIIKKKIRGSKWSFS